VFDIRDKLVTRSQVWDELPLGAAALATPGLEAGGLVWISLGWRC
jgi:hypothetical protein